MKVFNNGCRWHSKTISKTTAVREGYKLLFIKDLPLFSNGSLLVTIDVNPLF